MSIPADSQPPILDESWLNDVRERLSDAAGLLLCLDFDGTLAPIAENPDGASLASGNEPLLDHLASDPNVVVAIVSGRSLADVRERVGVDGIHYAGNHGLEWDDGDGRTVAEDARETQPKLDAVVDDLRSKLDGIEGCTVEDKELTATVHYRQTPPTQRETVVETVEDVVEPFGGLRCARGKEILEVRPDVPAGKDRVVDRLCERYPDHLGIFVGDDVTDESGFLAVVDEGFGVLVGDRSETAATVRVPDTNAVTMLLGWFAQLDVDTTDTTSAQ